MDLQYILSYIKTLELIISHTEEIIRLYDDIIMEYINYNNSTNNDNKNKNYIKDISNSYDKNMHDLKILNENKNYYKTLAYSLCVHEFCQDSIDITPEKSQNIVYCIHCGYTHI
jgi:hypothetical protein